MKKKSSSVKSIGKTPIKRGKNWIKNLSKARLDVQMNPTSLRLHRLQKNMTQADIAGFAGISLATYTAIERRKRKAKLVFAESISKKLGVPMDEVFEACESQATVAKKPHMNKFLAVSA